MDLKIYNELGPLTTTKLLVNKIPARPIEEPCYSTAHKKSLRLSSYDTTT